MRTLLLAKFLIFFVFSVTAQFFFENPVSWDFKAVEKETGIYELYFNGTIKSPWYVYAMELEKEGPIPTSIEFNTPKAYILVGEPVELSKPVVKYDPGFEFNVGMYSRKAEFMQIVRVSSSKQITVDGYIEFQSCNDETCLPPYQQEFSFTLQGDPSYSLTESHTSTDPLEKNTITGSEPVTPEQVAAEETQQTDHYDQTISSNEIVPYTGDMPGTGTRSLLAFLVIAFLAGLAAILTPCVFPMIPMTVSFFMRGSSNRGMAIIKGLVFGLSIILIYTGLGVLVGLTGMGPAAGTTLSTHWIPNLIFFLLFMVFAASFLGMFELIIPSGLINKADKHADKGGTAGAFFMGVTTVLVSFSCTGPIVGSLLIESAGGIALKPILGMFFFSLAFALPFTLLAIFPSMLGNIPKSGGWLNSIKVVLGFIVLAFGMKFLSSIDQTYHLKILSREIFLSIWFILSIMLGLYFLGKIKFAHDRDLPYISVPRFTLALASLTFAVYIFTGILGADLISIASVIPPKSDSTFSLSSPSKAVDAFDQSSTYCGPGKYDQRFTLPHGIKGYFSYKDGIKCAIEKNKPVFLDFTGHSCSNCKQMESRVWSDPVVLKMLKEEFVVISLYTDDRTIADNEDFVISHDGSEMRTIGEINQKIEIEKFNTVATPLYVLLDHKGNLLAQPKGKDLNVQNFIDFLEEGKENFY